ncbi:serine O-acetyltransferase EpsC [Roseimicrobium sp. ORNL1]|uniref:serine O-acetyltransferase EpsC n=1 Tax=Roseimicrobium sp. ORNL1 TaxID=2711231 RepID=UPI0013E1C618|nr:serine O-acetyltransferase EpsC [Roseimicrobium sp. ORNL1]QIF04948.1 serine acetyltransferase [Roseimicrobium sp. ORNL1]
MDCRQEEIVTGLLKSYQEIGGINHFDGTNLPSKHVIAILCDDLLHLLFPGFYSEEAVSADELPLAANELVANVRSQLSEEIAHSLRYKNGDGSGSKALAQDYCCKFLSKLPEVRCVLQTDVEAAYEGDPAAKSYEEIILAYPGLEAIAIQRAAHELYKMGVPLIPRMMTEWVHSRTGIDIHPGAQIGTHFFIDHGTGVVIGETCVIGHHVKLYHGVTLGARSFAKDEKGNPVKGIKRHPNVEDHVTIYPNVTVLGGDTTIGARSTIGANVFLMHSIAADTLLAVGDQDFRMLDKSKKRAS